jgi:hypothetical protein
MSQGQEEFTHLRSVFFDFYGTLRLQSIMLSVNEKTYSGFPQNIPDSMREDLADDLDPIIQALNEARDQLQLKSPPRPLDLDITKSGLTKDFLLLIISRIASDSSLAGIDDLFKVQSRRQTLVMIFAHFEALLYEFMRAIYLKEPRQMASRKVISLEDIVSATENDTLKDIMLDKALERWSYESMRNKIELFEKSGISLREFPDLKNRIFLLEALRHIIIHNGSRVDEKFQVAANKFGSGVCQDVGATYPIRPEDLLELFSDLAELSKSLYHKISAKFFKITTTKHLRIT